MRDIHCHILPGVDDGARTLEESLQMLQAAKDAGITSIVCTPHCRSPYFDFDKMWSAFHLLKSKAGGFPLQMGFEVNIAKLKRLGLEWADRLHFDGSDEFLLELEDDANEIDFREYNRIIYELQGRGYHIIIAHPERYKAIQKNPSLATDLMRNGCKLQASADFLNGGRTLSFGGGKIKKTAVKLFEDMRYSYIASDAHNVKHYKAFKKAIATYDLRGSHAAL